MKSSKPLTTYCYSPLLQMCLFSFFYCFCPWDTLDCCIFVHEVINELNNNNNKYWITRSAEISMCTKHCALHTYMRETWIHTENTTCGRNSKNFNIITRSSRSVHTISNKILCKANYPENIHITCFNRELKYAK